MVHPRYRVVGDGEPLPRGADAGLSDHGGPLAAALRADRRRAGTLALRRYAAAGNCCAKLRLADFAQSVLPCTARRRTRALARTRRAHPPGLAARQVRRTAGAAAVDAHGLPRARARGRPPLPPTGRCSKRFLGTLPFRLTARAERAWREIAADLAQPHPMQRLLQGDVGSGKTIVAALAACAAIENGYQAAVMAPTEILAEQH